MSPDYTAVGGARLWVGALDRRGPNVEVTVEAPLRQPIAAGDVATVEYTTRKFADGGNRAEFLVGSRDGDGSATVTFGVS